MAPTTIQWQVLDLEVRLSLPDPRLAGLAGEFVPKPRQPGISPQILLELAVESGPRGYELHAEGEIHPLAEEPRDAAYALHLVLERILPERVLGGPPRLHGFAANPPGGEAIFVGAQGAGKTTTALALLRAGVEVYGDEKLLILDDGAWVYPRRFHLKKPSLEVFPELRGLFEGRPAFLHFSFLPFVFMDPGDLGHTWRSPHISPTALYYLRPNFGRNSCLEAAPVHELLPLLLGQCVPGKLEFGAHLRRLTALLKKCRTYYLHNGTPQSTARLLLADN